MERNRAMGLRVMGGCWKCHREVENHAHRVDSEFKLERASISER